MTRENDIDSLTGHTREPVPLPAPPVQPEVAVKYETIFDNRSDESWKLYVGSKVFYELKPHEKISVPQWAETCFSRWTEATKHPNGKVTLKERLGFTENFPPGAFLTILRNNTQRLQVLRIADRAMEVQPGFHVTVAVGFDDPHAPCREIVWETAVKQVEEGGYLRDVEKTEMVKVLRNKAEMARLQAEIEKVALEISRRHQKRLPKVD